MFSYETWMLILAAAAALPLPFVVLSTVVDVLDYRRNLRTTDTPRPKLRRRIWVLAAFTSVMLFGLIFAAHSLIPGDRSGGAVWTQTRYEGKPLGMAWSSAILPSHRTRTGDFHISAFEVWGKNLGPEQPRFKDAAIISGIDGTEIKLTVGDNTNGMFDPADTAPIPVDAQY